MNRRGDVMSRMSVTGCVLAIAMLLPIGGSAQQEQEPLRPYVYGMYFECDVARQGLADEIFELAYMPAFEAAVDDGTIGSFGWLAHHTGSKWRRLQYHSSPELGPLLSVLGTVNREVGEKYPEMRRAFSEVCGTHDDYIWQQVSGSRGGDVTQPRGEVGFSVYFQCDPSRESRADEIVESVFAEVYDSQVAAGRIDSWGWMEHVIGGKWRRIVTMTAADRKSLIAARSAIVEEIDTGRVDAAREFDSICGSHQDFIWNIVHEKP
jgi:hypothetical protein